MNYELSTQRGSTLYIRRARVSSATTTTVVLSFVIIAIASWACRLSYEAADIAGVAGRVGGVRV